MIRRRALARKMIRVGKPFIYREFKITIFNNKRWSFRYEWQIEAITRKAKALLLRNYKREKGFVMHDPTSNPSIAMTKDRAFEKVNEMHSPFWYREWHY